PTASLHSRLGWEIIRDVSWIGFSCRSTATVRTERAQSSPQACPPSHPGRVLLRFGGGIGFVVGAPPRCERGRHAFAPGAGAPTVRRWDWFCCRSTASVRTGRAQSTPHAAPIRTRGGCSYGSGVGLVF